MPKTSFRPAKKAWTQHGSQHVTQFPHYVTRVPGLLELCGVYSLTFSLPSWWNELVAELQHRFEEPIVELFRGVTPEEFRQGQFEPRRHKELRAKLESEESRRLISSPRIGRFLVEQLGEDHDFTRSFNTRGSKLQEKELVISVDPWDIIGMATRGKSWTSCQDYTNSAGKYLWASLSDPGLAIAFVRTRNDQSDKNMDTRTLLRYVWTYRTPTEPSRPGIVLELFYGDAAYIQLIQEKILEICQDHRLALFEYIEFKRNQGGNFEGFAKDCETLTVRGPAVNFRGAPYPWLDAWSAKWVKEKKHRGFHRLEAEVRVVNPSLVENYPDEPSGI